MKFKTFVENELYNTDSDYSKELYFENVRDKCKLFVKDGTYNIMKYQDYFFLTKNDEYIASVQNYSIKIENKTINICSAHSKERGMYKILLILLLKKVHYIISDTLLSSSALKFWKNMSSDKHICGFDLDNNPIEFSNDILTNPELRVGLKYK